MIFNALKTFVTAKRGEAVGEGQQLCHQQLSAGHHPLRATDRDRRGWTECGEVAAADRADLRPSRLTTPYRQVRTHTDLCVLP